MARHRKRKHVHDFQVKSIGAGLVRNVCQTCGDVAVGVDETADHRDDMLSVTPVTRKLMFRIALDEELEVTLAAEDDTPRFGQRRRQRLRPGA